MHRGNENDGQRVTRLAAERHSDRLRVLRASESVADHAITRFFERVGA